MSAKRVAAVVALLLPGLADAGLLADLYAEALRTEPGYQAALSDRDAALQGVPLLRASILPQLSLDGYYSHLIDDTQRTRFPGYEPQELDADIWQLGLRLTQPVFDWAVFARLRQIDATAAVAELTLREARQQLMLTLSRRYFGWLGALDDLRLATEQKQAIAEQRKEAAVRVETGYATEADLQQLIAAYDSAVADELTAAARLRSAREAVLEVSGVAPRFPQPLAQDLQTLPPQPAQPEQWVERALANNLGLRLAELDLERAREDYQAQRGEHMPSLALEVEHRWQDTAELQLGREAETSSALLRLHVPLFSGGGTSAKVRASSLGLDAAQSRLQAQRRSVVRATRDAYDGVVTGIQRLRASDQSVASSQAALEAIAGGWESGIRTSAELVDARKNVFQAQRNAAAARYAFLLNVLALQEVVGSLQDQDLLALDQRLLSAE